MPLRGTTALPAARSAAFSTERRSSALEDALKPRLRGVVHQWAFFAALAAAAVLLLIAPTPEARLGGAVYAFGLAGLLGTSALYHRGKWSARAAAWLRRLDHSMIFVLIAGTYTPISLLALEGPLAKVVLVLVWAGAVAGIVFSLVWIDAPTWLVAIVYVALGWVLVAVFPALYVAIGPVGFGLITAGGLMYTLGAVVYARGRPDPRPTVFGYHEVFHVMVVCAAALHYAAIVGFVLPGA